MIHRLLAATVAVMNTHSYFDIGSSTLGCVLVAINDKGVCAILLGDSSRAVTRELRERFPVDGICRAPERLTQVLPRVVDLVEGRRAALGLPLAPDGTPFQQRVWRALQTIEPGRTASYTDIARRIDAPTSFRAVAQACGANQVALAIPCHRVVRSDGGLSGYRWGVARKKALLEREAR